MDAVPPPSPTTSGSSTPSSPAASSPGGSSDTAASASSPSGSEHTPTRRRLVKVSTVSAKGGAGGTATGPPGFVFDRSTASPAGLVGTGAGPVATSPGISSPQASLTNNFRDRTASRPTGKGDVQVDYPLLSPHGPGGTSGPAKLGRQPFTSNPGVMGEVRPLGRRPEVSVPRRHEPPSSGPKHASEDVRIQNAKRACLARAQTMGATGNFKSFDSPFGNYLVPVIPNHLFNKTSTLASVPSSPSSPSSPSNVNP